jgi:hypothetical protein
LLAPVAALTEALGFYRIHGANVTGIPKLLSLREVDDCIIGTKQVLDARAQFPQQVHGVDPRSLDQDQWIRKSAPSLFLYRAVLRSERWSPKEVAQYARGIRLWLWRFMFALPAPVARAVYLAWRRDGRVQHLLRKLLGRPMDRSTRRNQNVRGPEGAPA